MSLTIEELVSDPARARDLGPATCAAVLAAAICGLLLTRPEAPEAPVEPDRALTVKEVAARVGLRPNTLYGLRHQEPWCACLLPLGTRSVRFSASKITALLAAGSDPRVSVADARPRKGTRPPAQPPFLRRTSGGRGA